MKNNYVFWMNGLDNLLNMILILRFYKVIYNDINYCDIFSWSILNCIVFLNFFYKVINFILC